LAAGLKAVKQLFVFCLATVLFPLSAEEAASQTDGDAVGLALPEVFARYGYPDTVHAVRGVEEWQDDVVFRYGSRKLDIYIYKDRVWQTRVSNVFGLTTGDRKVAAMLILDGHIEDKGGYLLYTYQDTVWPKYARFNIDGSGRISAIYIYRPDM
jgi:hypothetical protein